MNTKKYYIVKVTDSGTEYYVADNEWTWIKAKATYFHTEKEACEIKENLRKI